MHPRRRNSQATEMDNTSKLWLCRCSSLMVHYLPFRFWSARTEKSAMTKNWNARTTRNILQDGRRLSILLHRNLMSKLSPWHGNLYFEYCYQLINRNPINLISRVEPVAWVGVVVGQFDHHQPVDIINIDHHSKALIMNFYCPWMRKKILAKKNYYYVPRYLLPQPQKKVP